MIMDRITRETKQRLTKQLTDMVINSKNDLIASTVKELEKDNSSKEVIEQIKAVFEEDAQNKLLLIPQVVEDMMSEAKNRGDIAGTKQMLGD